MLRGGLPLNPDLPLREVVSRLVKIAIGGTWFHEANYSVSDSFMSPLCLVLCPVHKKKALCVCGMAVECYESGDVVRRLAGQSHHRHNLSCVTLGELRPFCGFN